MNFWVLREKGGHWSVRRVGYEPELGFCYPEFSVSCQCAYSSPLFTKTNSWAVLLNISLVCGRETQTVSGTNLEKLHSYSLFLLCLEPRTALPWEGGKDIKWNY